MAFNGGAGLGDLMRQAGEMRKRLQKAQEELALTEVSGESGAGLVRVLMTCDYKVRRVLVDPSLLGADEKTTLQDLLKAAFNDALHKVERTARDKLPDIGGAGFPRMLP